MKELRKYNKYIKAYLVWLRKRIKKLENDFKEYEDASGIDPKYAKGQMYFETKKKTVNEFEDQLEQIKHILKAREKPIEYYAAFIGYISMMQKTGFEASKQFESLLPDSPARSTLLYEITLLPDYEEFGFLSQQVKSKIEAALTIEKEQLHEVLRKVRKLKTYKDRFIVDKKTITVVTSFAVSLYKDLIQMEDKNIAMMSDFFVEFGKYIRQAIEKNSHLVLASKCSLSFQFISQSEEATKGLMSFNPSISTVNQKFFTISISALQLFFDNRMDIFSGTIAHEVTHAFDEKIDTERADLLRSLFDISKGKLENIAGFVLAGFLINARSEGLAKFSENNVINGDAYGTRFAALPYFIEEFGKLQTHILAVAQKGIHGAQVAKSFGSTCYSLGYWMFHIISCYLLVLGKKDRKYFVLNQKSYDLLGEDFAEHAFSPDLLYKEDWMKAIFKRLRIIPYKLKDVKKYTLAEDYVVPLRLSKEDFPEIYAHLKKLSAFDLYRTYKKACEFLGVPRNTILFNDEMVDMINQIEDHFQALQAEKMGLRREMFAEL